VSGRHRTVRLFAIVSLGLLAAYHLLRLLAAACSGPACDWYIVVSLLVPILILISVAVTGISAAERARSAGDQIWSLLLMLLTICGALGPIATAIVFRDSPDVVVSVGTVLSAALPIAALAYTCFRPKTVAVR
jgi:hypothetical protein